MERPSILDVFVCARVCVCVAMDARATPQLVRIYVIARFLDPKQFSLRMIAVPLRIQLI